MKKKSLITSAVLLLLSLFVTPSAQAQTISFIFANAENTNDGTDDYYEIDVMISTDSDFKLGSGLLYFNYNTAAFGENVHANDNVEFTYPEGDYILGAVSFLNVYGSFVTNDNTSSRVAFSWQQTLSSGGIAADNVTAAAAALFHIKIKYEDVSEDPSFCFESGEAFDDQTYTACGPASFAIADCTNTPGTQLLDDNFDCSLASLPVEMLSFTIKPNDKDVQLTWLTATEINNSHFEIERSTDARVFEKIGLVGGAGTTHYEQQYQFVDQRPATGTNYYRLRQVDYDGQFDYSEIKTAYFETGIADSPKLSLYPNPTLHTLHLQSEQRGIENIEVFNSFGQKVLEQQASVSELTHTIDVEGLAAGTYYVRASNSTQLIKFIKV
ncbi:MAG: T9SS type A sorting domain-containing protein [Bacteroidota bacterium]